MKILTESGWKQVNELSDDLLSRYSKRALEFGQDAYDAGESKNPEKKARLLKAANRRKAGLNLLLRKKGIKESAGPPGTKELNAAAYNIIDEILPDLEDAMRHSGSSVYNAVIDHVADRLHDMYHNQGVPSGAFRKAAEYAAKQAVHDDREDVKKKSKYAEKDRQRAQWKAKGLTTRGTVPLPPKIKKQKEPAHDRAGFKTKLGKDRKVFRGTGSHGHAKYTKGFFDESASRLEKLRAASRRRAGATSPPPGWETPLPTKKTKSAVDKYINMDDQDLKALIAHIGAKHQKKKLGEETMKTTLQVIKEAAKTANKSKPKPKAKAANPKVAMGGSGDSETGYEDFISAATDDSNLDKVYDKMREALKIKIAAAAMHGNTGKVKLLKKRLANLDKHREGEGSEKEDKD